eukprot:gene10643-2480_t
MPQVRIRAIGVILLTTVVSTVVSIVSGYFVYAKSIESLEDTVKLLSEAQVDVLEASINETFGDVRRAQHVLSDLISSRWPAALLAPPPPAPPAPPADCDDALAGGPACTFGGMCDCQRDLIDAGYACGTAPFRDAILAANKALEARKEAEAKGEKIDSDSESEEKKGGPGRPPQLTPEEDEKLDELLVALRVRTGTLGCMLVALSRVIVLPSVRTGTRGCMLVALSHVIVLPSPTPNSGAAMAEAKKPMPKAGFVKVEKEALKRVSEDELMSVQKKIKED